MKLLIFTEGHQNYTLCVEEHSLHQMLLQKEPGKDIVHSLLFVALYISSLKCYPKALVYLQGIDLDMYLGVLYNYGYSLRDLSSFVLCTGLYILLFKCECLSWTIWYVKMYSALEDHVPEEAIQLYIEACTILEDDGKEQMAFDLYRDVTSAYIKLQK